VSESPRSKAGRELAKTGASKGGHARAATLTPDERRDIARRAVMARWQKAGKPIVWKDDDKSDPPDEPEAPTLPYSLYQGPLRFGDIELECHVLDDGRRVLTQRQVVRLLTGGTDSSNLKRYLRSVPSAADFELRPIQFLTPPRPQPAFGYEGTEVVEILELYLDARSKGELTGTRLRKADMAEIVIRACAKVGIIALIDEATGYQRVRDKNALQLKLQAFIADEMQDWARMFPEEFWLELARLEGIRYSPRSRPIRWGKYVMAFVYDAIDPDVGQELRALNPNPHYRKNHHQWLKRFGRERVNDQLQRVIAVMKLCGDMADFERKFAHVFQKKPLQLTFDDLWRA
jgi:hypothetical protein